MNDLTEIEGVMKTDAKGVLYISSKAAFDQFFRDNPGASFTFKIEKTSPISKERLIAYYYAEVIPKVIKGYRNLGEILTKQDADDRMAYVGSARLSYVNTPKGLKESTKEVKELGYFEVHRHIQEVIIFAAYNLETIIEEPK